MRWLLQFKTIIDECHNVKPCSYLLCWSSCLNRRLLNRSKLAQQRLKNDKNKNGTPEQMVNTCNVHSFWRPHSEKRCVFVPRFLSSYDDRHNNKSSCSTWWATITCNPIKVFSTGAAAPFLFLGKTHLQDSQAVAEPSQPFPSLKNNVSFSFYVFHIKKKT